MPRAIVHTRVSTDEQAESGLGDAAQIAACRAWCEREGFEFFGPYTDDGVSGAAPLHKRAALVAAIAEIKKSDVLLVARRDRLGREPIVIAMAESLVKSKGGRVVSAAGEGTESDEPLMVVMRRVMDAFAEYTRLTIKSNTRNALAVKKKKGERCGNVPYGWEPDPDSPPHEESGIPVGLRAVPVEQERRRLIVSLADLGLNPRRIAARLNADGVPTKRGRGAWHPGSVRSILLGASVERGAS